MSMTILDQIKKMILPRVSAKEKSLYQRLNIVFGFFFLIPTFGLLYFLITYDLLNDQSVCSPFLCGVSDLLSGRICDPAGII